MVRVCAVGMAVMDFVFDMPRFPSEAIKYKADDAVAIGGGCAANAAFAAAKLGAEVQLAARLGDDLVGDLILADLASVGVDTSGCHRANGGRSSFSSVIVDADGERQIVNFRGSGLTETTDWVRPEADAVLVDTRWSAGAIAALTWARQAGVPGVVDAEAPVDPKVVAVASHVAFSRSGLAQFSGITDLAESLSVTHAALPGAVIVTDGEHGAYCWDDGVVHHVAGYRVDVRDTLAAGDIWHGAFAMRLAEDASTIESMQFANAAAALKCSAFGGRAGCPDRPTVEAFMRENHQEG